MVTELFRILQQICRRGTGILLVEQNVRQALGVCDHAYILEQGRVVAQGGGEGCCRVSGYASLISGFELVLE